MTLGSVRKKSEVLVQGPHEYFKGKRINACFSPVLLHHLTMLLDDGESSQLLFSSQLIYRFMYFVDKESSLPVCKSIKPSSVLVYCSVQVSVYISELWVESMQMGFQM